ncbi:MAG: AraC family transcriptional regulator [Bacteroidales bacterium]|nr:AraC family transcriptional regulator [Bacteroidales bacterium]
METQVGLELCTAGTMEKMTVKGRCAIRPGMMMIHSPLFPMLELSRSNDYTSVVLHDDLENIYSIFSQNPPTAQQIINITPYLLLDQERKTFFVQRVEEISAKEKQLLELQHPMRSKLLSTAIDLLKQETLLEFAFLISAQLQDKPQSVSHKRQILMTFLLSLNQEYKQHRTVNYYAEKQAITPRHLSDIVKQETGYTPMDWINMVTINQAKNLLRQPKIMVKQVADELGFPEQFTFRKYFKAHTGMSPSEYQSRQ